MFAEDEFSVVAYHELTLPVVAVMFDNEDIYPPVTSILLVDKFAIKIVSIVELNSLNEDHLRLPLPSVLRIDLFDPPEIVIVELLPKLTTPVFEEIVLPWIMMLANFALPELSRAY